ncbi:multidrug resistance protein fnx1 [Naematelia encephala]|uniref:Multidrug resistance protein fnx1 n=1 Tax=Naematelia encephala TaxID=71784 RepID=A0A1Y2B677_9TREE|nr:multidrug resistance protein fnx1 [Naematelia encephala]
MSAIVIHTATPSERTSLLPKSTLNSQSSTLNASYSNNHDSSNGNNDSSISINRQQPTTKVLSRTQPLKETISTARFVIVCIGIWSSNFVFAFQSTAIPTLAPGIGSGFERAELASYLGGLFTLASAAVIPVYGVFMESLGRKFAAVTACFFFGLGTILCAVSGSMYQLIAARAFAGLGGGGLLTVSSVIVTDLVPLRDRGFYQGIMMTVFGSGSMIGGPVAGWLADKYGWPWAFWVQIPIVIFCATIVTIFLPSPPIPPTHTTLLSGLGSLDWLGSVLLLGSVTSLILGVSFHTSFLEPWSAPIVWGLLVASVLSLALFVYVETKVRRPIVPMSLLKSRHRSAVMASGFFLSVGNQAFMFQVPVYFSVIVNTSTAQAGVLLSVCGGLGLAIGSMVAGQHIRSGGAYRVLGICSMVPAVVSSLVAALWTPQWPTWAYYLTFLPSSLGYSVFLCCQLIALISGVDSKAMPQATALLYTTRTLGGTIGVSMGGSIQLGALTSHLRSRLADAPNREATITAILHSKAAIRQLPEPYQSRALEAYANSISTVWLVSAVIALITVITAFGIQEKDVHGKTPQSGIVKATGGGVVEGGFGEGLGQGTIQGETRRS